MTTLRLLSCLLLCFAACSKDSGDSGESPPAATTEKPTTNEPTTNEPTTNEPTTDEPTTDEPTTDEPTTDEPTTDEPTTDEPTTDEPTTDAPTADTPTADPAKVAPVDKSPKDLQVLPKSWSDKQVRDYMKKQINRGLGVKCKHCHDPKNFADNSKAAKEIARDMIKLQNRINKKDFGGKQTVTCFTCHKGKVKVSK